MPAAYEFTISNDGKDTVLAAMRQHLPEKPSWSAVKKILRGRHVAIGGVLCLDEARRLSNGEVVTICDRPLPPPPSDEDVKVRYVDSELVVVEKPAGMVTLRRPSDLGWSWARKNRQPTLDECVPRLIGQHAAKQHHVERIQQRFPRLLSVHRIDRDSSGLLVFARTEATQTHLIRQFAHHDAVRQYLALIPGTIDNSGRDTSQESPAITVSSQFIRDRGDGLRGSTTDTSIGQQAITHFRTLRKIGDYSELECRLETGRTNQIRIHLAEMGHPICGDTKYRGAFQKPPVVDSSNIHRMALHAAGLKFEHPTTKKLMDFHTPWPFDMLRFLNRLRTPAI